MRFRGIGKKDTQVFTDEVQGIGEDVWTSLIEPPTYDKLEAWMIGRLIDVARIRSEYHGGSPGYHGATFDEVSRAHFAGRLKEIQPDGFVLEPDQRVALPRQKREFPDTAYTIEVKVTGDLADVDLRSKALVDRALFRLTATTDGIRDLLRASSQRPTKIIVQRDRRRGRRARLVKRGR